MGLNKLAGDLNGRNVFVSGGSRGLGFSVCQSLVDAGANVAFCGRNEPELTVALGILKAQVRSDQRIVSIVLDVSDKEQVFALGAGSLTDFGAIDILVCNAGILGPIGSFLENDLDEWIQSLNVNLLGSLYLIYTLLPQMVERGHGKIIQISGGGASGPLPGLTAYSASKVAVIRFVETLAKEYSKFGIDINGVAPGMLKTRLLDEMLEAGPERVGEDLFRRSVKKFTEQEDSSFQACELIKFLASSESDGISGKLISAEWDDWREWPNHLQDLQNSDLYTLRRIVGHDRDQTWGDR